MIPYNTTTRNMAAVVAAKNATIARLRFLLLWSLTANGGLAYLAADDLGHLARSLLNLLG